MSAPQLRRESKAERAPNPLVIVCATSCVAALALTIVDIALKLHTWWLHLTMYTLGLVGPSMLAATKYRFITQDFLPVYERLEDLCARVGMRCAIRTSRIRWMVRWTLLCLVLSALFSIAGPILWNRSLLIQGIKLFADLGFLAGILFVGRHMLSTQDEADRLLRNLENGRGLGEPRPLPRAARFILLLIPRRHREHLVGDLDEEFTNIVLPEYGIRKARLWYWCQVSMSIWPLLWGEIRRIFGLLVLWKGIR